MRRGAAIRHLLALTPTAAAVLLLARPDPAALGHGLAAPHDWVQTAGTDAAAAQLALGVVWLAAAWLAVGLLAGLAGLAPGAVGHCGRAVAGGLLPRVVRAGLAGAAGVCLIAAPAVTTAAGAANGHAFGAPSAVATTADSAGDTPSIPSAHWPQSHWPQTHWPRGRSAPKPLPWPGHASTPAPPNTPSPPPPAAVTVRSGDSLWSLAAGRLGPHPTTAQIAGAWPRWYRANRSVVGDDPGLIRPGQHLTVPSEQGSPR